jgi:hypothetical protein
MSTKQLVSGWVIRLGSPFFLIVIFLLAPKNLKIVTNTFEYVLLLGFYLNSSLFCSIKEKQV